MSVHIQGEPTGAACTLRIRPTTTPSASTSKSSSLHWPEGREAEARLRISEDTLRGHHISLGAPCLKSAHRPPLLLPRLEPLAPTRGISGAPLPKGSAARHEISQVPVRSFCT